MRVPGRVAVVMCAFMAAAGMAAAADPLPQLVLVQDGQSRATIVCPVSPPRPAGDLTAEEQEAHRLAVRARDHSACRGALRLQEYLKLITGADVPMVTDDKPVSGTLIHVGPTKYIKELGVDLGKLSGDSFTMRVVGNNLVLAGADSYMGVGSARNEQVGSFNAVQTFLEDNCGVRWFMPGSLGEDVLPRKTISVPRDLDRTEVASIKFRQMASAHTWRHNNKLENSLRLFTEGGHSWGMLVPLETYFKKHPEYYALVSGKRTFVRKGDPSLCTSNPDVFRIAVENVQNLFDRGYDLVQLGHPDSYGSGVAACECDACMAIGDVSRGGLSKRVYDFHCAIAREVKKSHPDKMVHFIIYGPTSTVPDGFKGFPDNVLLELTSSTESALSEWSKYGASMSVYVYNWTTYYHMGFGPKSSIKKIIREMDRYRRHNVIGIYWCGGSNNWGLEGVQYYLAGKLQWNMGLDPQAILDDFYTRFYRKAQKPMEAFFELLDERKNSHAVGGSPQKRYLAYFPGEVISRMDAFLAEASNLAAGDEVVLKRIGLTEAAWRYVKVTTAVFDMNTKYEKERDAENLVALRDAVRARERFVESTLEAQAQKIRKSELAPVFGRGRGELREEILTGTASYFDGPFSMAFDPMIAFLREHGTVKAGIQKTDHAPVIDGRADDACWNPNRGLKQDDPEWQVEEPPLRLLEDKTGKEAKIRTVVKLRWDDKNIYALFVTSDPEIDKLHTHRKGDLEKHVWAEDCVELFLCRDPEVFEYYHFMLSWRGNSYDGRRGFVDDPLDPARFKEDLNWNAKWEKQVSVDKEKGQWVAEMAIPLSEIGGPLKPGDEWHFNINYEAQHRGHYASWSPTFENAFQSPHRFGIVTFVK